MSDVLASQRHQFDIPPGVAYLNCAYMPPMPGPVREAGRRALDEHAPWATTSRDFFEPGERLRAAVAALIGADADGVAFRRGTGSTTVMGGTHTGDLAQHGRRWAHLFRIRERIGPRDRSNKRWRIR